MWFNSDLINAYRNSISGQKDILIYVVYLPGLESTTSGQKPLPGPHMYPCGQWPKGSPGHWEPQSRPWNTHCTVYTYACVYAPIYLYYTHHACILGLFSHVQLFQPIWTVALQAPLSMELSRQESWSGLPVPSPGDLSNLGIKAESPALQEDSLPYETPGKPTYLSIWYTFVIYIYVHLLYSAYLYMYVTCY